MERSHPPLRRVMRGQPNIVDPTLNKERKEKRLSARSLVSEQDSCYSSCSEESHASLSRESSDALSSTFSGLSVSESESRGAATPCALPLDLVEFASGLGFSEAQLQRVLEKIGPNATKDNVLQELVRGGKAALTPSPSLPCSSESQQPTLRPIVIDGSNIAMTHGKKEVFSCAGIRECVNFFVKRGHTDVLVFIPQFRKEAARADCPITDQHILTELDNNGRIAWTPSRRINGRRVVCHDDRYILKTAEAKDAIIVSNDEYRDLVKETPSYKKLVETRLLMYSFVDGRFMPPDDPLGRHGPTLSQFLMTGAAVVQQSATVCPYAKKCTYGNKCKFLHPERPNGIHTSVTERLMRENGNRRKSALTTRPSMIYESSPLAATAATCPTTSSHAAVARAQSLNVAVEGRLGHHFGPVAGTPAPPSFDIYSASAALLPPVLPSWPRHLQSHNALCRNQSAPIADQPVPPMEVTATSTSRCNSLLNVLPPTPSLGAFSSQMFTPSAAIWGQSEFSLGPLPQPPPQIDAYLPPSTDARARLQYHLSNVFPKDAVAAVMAAHPDEANPQRLCEFILAFHRSFNPSVPFRPES